MTDDSEALVLVYSTYDASDGMLAKGMLETQGIDVFIKGGATDQAYPTSGTFLWVAPENESTARELLKEVTDGDFRDSASEEAEEAATQADTDVSD